MSEKEKQELYKQINNLTLLEFSKLCLKIVKKIADRKPNEKSIGKHMYVPNINGLINIMIKNNIKIEEKKE